MGEQVITCKIVLSMTTDSSYNPAACAQSSNIGQTCATFYIGKTCNSANPLTVNANTSGNIGHGANQLRPDMNDVVECLMLLLVACSPFTTMLTNLEVLTT